MRKRDRKSVHIINHLQCAFFLQNTGHPSVYGQITSQGGREERELKATDGFEIESFDEVKRSFTAEYRMD